MKRTDSFHAGMARLALAAMLLLALLPTLGRLASLAPAPHAGMVHAAPVAAAPAATLPAADATSRHDGHDGHEPPPHHHHHAASGDADMAEVAPRQAGSPAPARGMGDEDCGYCPLLLSLLAASIAFALLRAQAPAPARFAAVASARRRQRHPCGLGSRGPPRLGVIAA